MKTCNHAQWLSVCKQGDETALFESSRPRQLLDRVADPDEAQPSLFTFVGDRTKVIALEKIFGIRRRRIFKSKQRAGDVNLHLGTGSELSSRPLLVAECSLNTNGFQSHAMSSACHDLNRLPLEIAEIHCPEKLEQAILGRLLLPFTDLVCYFASDLGGFAAVARHLAGWHRVSDTRTVPPLTKPTVMIVTDKMPPTAQREKEARKAFLWLLKEETAGDPFDVIADVDVVATHPSRAFRSSPNWTRLKNRLLRASNKARKHRSETRTLYSMTHFVAFTEAACRHFSGSATNPFNFIQASRVRNCPAADLTRHLAHFIGQCTTPEELVTFAAPVIASSFLLDSYPPDCHEFDPRHIFPVMYERALSDALGERVISFPSSRDIILRTGILNVIQTHLYEYFETLTASSTSSSASIHLANLRRFHGKWGQVYSDVTCISCLNRDPEHGMPCGHMLCEPCVQIYGNESEPWTYRIGSCLFCMAEWSEDIVVGVKPPTRGVSILCLDGGGTRAIIPLTLMKRIQEQIQERTGLSLAFQKHFKLVASVSSGTLTALSMYHEGKSLEECINAFFDLAQSSFKDENVSGIPFISRLTKLFRLYAQDGLYRPENIESVLKNLFGRDATMSDCSYATQIGAKLCVLVATVLKNPSCRIFTNYHQTRQSDQKLEAEAANDPSGRNVRLWEIARAASAAPVFFPAKHITDVGIFQDAGLLVNDPVATAVSEAAAIYPSTPIDLILSLGTGKIPDTEYERPTEMTKAPPQAAVRIRDLLWEKTRDRQVKQAFAQHPKYHRLDHEVDRDYALDNVSDMVALKSAVESDTSVSESISQVAERAVASLFYFELVALPARWNGEYGSGRILCSLPGKDLEFETLISWLSSRHVQFYLNGVPIPGVWRDRDFLDQDGNFCKAVKLEASERISISVRVGGKSARAWDISGSPFTVADLIRAQGLNACFGNERHRKRRSASGDIRPAKRVKH